MAPAVEQSIVLHLITAFLSLYCFIVFTYWWKKVGGATFIYGITTFLALGIGITHFTASLAYIDYFGDGICTLVNSWWWPLRSFPQAIAMLAYAINITYKIKHSKNSQFLHGKEE